MFVTRGGARRRLVLVGIGAIVAGAIFLGSERSDDPADRRPADARIPGAPLDLPTPAKPAPPPSATSVKPVPPLALPAALDLDKMTFDTERDRYVIVLADGRRAELTLDPALQKLAEKLLDQSRAPRGAIVAMAPDGRVLALAGRRTEEPTGSQTGTFDWRLATEVWAPSASIFKLVTASALVNAGVDPDGRVCYHGGIRSVLDHNLVDDAKRDHRCESLAYGVAHSNNAILGKLAYQKLAPSALATEAQALGWIGALPTTLALPGNIGELVIPPNRDLDYARTAAGFANDSGGAKLSVMGGALVAATFAGDGELPAARLVASIDGIALPRAPSKRLVPADTARAVAKMMEQTCEDGSARRVFKKGTKVAGKTGTLTKTEPFYMEHSWFVGYAPAAKPEIIVSVLLGNPESWHLRGQQAARRMIDRALKPAKAREKDRRAKRSRS